jgi:hypothetical protein
MFVFAFLVILTIVDAGVVPGVAHGVADSAALPAEWTRLISACDERDFVRVQRHIVLDL